MTQSIDERLCAVWFSLKRDLTRSLLPALYAQFGGFKAIFEAGREEFKGFEDILERDVKLLSDKNTKEAEAVLRICEKSAYGLTIYGDESYPERLLNIYDPPAVLYFRGDMPDVDEEICVGVVGTRTASDKGKNIAKKLSFDMASMGAVVVSGMAKGIDAFAHAGALEAGQKTIAVFGCGVDRCYPSENEKLMEKIMNSGAVVSEFAPGAKPLSQNFPPRNRIISGLSLGVLIVEADLKSGALITAAHALDQGRDVFAVPGDIDKRQSFGTNSLIRSGAKLVMNAGDILYEYAGLFPHKITQNKWNKKPSSKEDEKDITGDYLLKTGAEKYDALSENEKKVFSVLTLTDTHIDEIAAKTSLKSNIVGSALTVLEVYSFVKRSPGQYFKLKIEV